MDHEFKIIYKFNLEDGYISGNMTRLYIDNIPLGLVQSVLFATSAQDIGIPPEIIINYNFQRPEDINKYSSDLKKVIYNTAIKLSSLKIIKSDLIQSLKKHINLKAFL